MFLVLVLTLFAINGHAILTTPMSNGFDNTGTINQKDSVSIRVKNGESSTISSGSVVVYSTSADDGATIASTSTSGVAAACVMKSSCAAGDLCYCQKYGYIESILFDAKYGGAAAGEVVYVSTASYYAASNDDVPSRAIPIAIVLDTISATGSVEAVLIIP